MPSKLIRKTHMYLALFLTPWMFLYAISSLAMNHNAVFKRYHGGEAEHWEKEKEQVLDLKFSADSKPEFMADQLLRQLDLAGRFDADLSKDGRRLTVTRLDPIVPRRITFAPEDGKLLMEEQAFCIEPRLSELHRRRGFQSPFLVDDLWTTMVDLAIISIIFWVLSGMSC